ncbi:MAG: hypothetical protein AB1352_00605 [Patescibacteria group bacterium]
MTPRTLHKTARTRVPHPHHTPHPHKKKKLMVMITVTICMIGVVAGWIVFLQRTVRKSAPSTSEIASRTHPSSVQIIQMVQQLQKDLQALPSPATIIKRITQPQPPNLSALAQRIAAIATTTPTSTPPLIPSSTSTGNILP